MEVVALMDDGVVQLVLAYCSVIREASIDIHDDGICGDSMENFFSEIILNLRFVCLEVDLPAYPMRLISSSSLCLMVIPPLVYL